MSRRLRSRPRRVEWMGKVSLTLTDAFMIRIASLRPTLNNIYPVNPEASLHILLPLALEFQADVCSLLMGRSIGTIFSNVLQHCKRKQERIVSCST
ncbi:hypothetical protein PsorP6_006493 [Peronosclerospora sorghi]|uniref:Uncharacterized protein n=1 Tax=Peronosclerospora sorghi TaxID=230839 RepID=A0ACC0W1M5_9STRA|nr:hypothetical protein PsorP6_006493 [Peronosclerospora sorghi]